MTKEQKEKFNKIYKECILEPLKQNNYDYSIFDLPAATVETASITHNDGQTEIAGNKTKYIMTVGTVEHVRTTSNEYNYAVVVEFFNNSFVICSKNPITVERVKNEKYQGLHTIRRGMSASKRATYRRENSAQIDQWIESGDLKMHFFAFNN